MKEQDLIRLIDSLSKGEKRNFKILANRTGSGNKRYVILFDWIEKYGTINDVKLIKKHPSIKSSQIPNLKNTLYKQVLKSLREINKDFFQEIEAREQFDFAKILYSKGDYKASLEYLQRAKKLALKLKKSPLIYLAVNFEKQIESQHITGSMSKRAVVLSEMSNTLIEEMELTNALSNLSLLLYGRYLKKGFVKSIHDVNRLELFFNDLLPKFQLESLNFKQRLYLYQSYVWYYYMLQDFAKNFKYALKWVELFEEYSEMKEIETAIYLKGLHNILSSLFVADKRRKFLVYFKRLISIEQNERIHWNKNERSLLLLFKFIHGINKIFLFSEYEIGALLVNELEQILLEDNHGWDRNRIMVFHYKIACIYFGNQEYEKALFWLNKIINERYGDLKQDIQCFAKILSLITHYELGNDILVSNQIVSTFRFLLKMRELGKIQREIFYFLRKTSIVNRKDLDDEFRILKDKLLIISEDQYERRPFLYLDIISWLDSKLLQLSMVEAMRKNRNNQ